MKRIAELSSRRNQLAPIYRLPDEILSVIFKFAQKDGSPVPIQTSEGLARVSKRWRQAALQTPRLWSTINTLHRPLLDTLLTRARGAPLEIYFYRPSANLNPGVTLDATYLYEQQFQECIASLVSRASQWRTLVLVNLGPTVVWPFINHPAPQLESLTLEIEKDSEYEQLDNLAIARNSFRGELPRLRELRLRRWHLPLDSPIYAHLEILSLDQINLGPMGPLFRVLRACPYLSELELKYITFSSPPAEAETASPIHLPRLCKLYIDWLQPWVLQSLLGSMHLSPPLCISGRCALSEEDDLRSILPSRPDFEDTMSRLLYIDSIYFTFPGPAGWCTLFALTPPTAPTVGPLLDMDFRHMNPTRENSTRLASRLFRNLGTEFPLRHLKKLEIRDLAHHMMPRSDFADALGHLSSLEAICFRKCASAFVSALIVTPGSQICPNLRCMGVIGAPLDGAMVLCLAESRAPLKGQGRNDGVVPLEELSFISCRGITKAVKGKLERFVPSVGRWNCDY
ncbi:hypothetical protein BOTBODRAFT_478565 [Botryobasidium botryosum FD-172 SS1]|uniref:F-box domain-containing protein n=1 Tax=Botryobasidium botryosum (strain FD-172 SS1) TaxID=930990 RepID=A0A067MTJ5_BOTB1|nr:hypothetical protein BOTBODRAFT_478565 [Botryobasidium botryosum FD-172 SS1]